MHGVSVTNIHLGCLSPTATLVDKGLPSALRSKCKVVWKLIWSGIRRMDLRSLVGGESYMRKEHYYQLDTLNINHMAARLRQPDGR